jgi:hypothetical protein
MVEKKSFLDRFRRRKGDGAPRMAKAANEDEDEDDGALSEERLKTAKGAPR